MNVRKTRHHESRDQKATKVTSQSIADHAKVLVLVKKRMANGSQNQIPDLIRKKTMSLSPEQGQAIRDELKRFAGDMNLSDEQKTKLHERLAFAAGRLHEYTKSHPEVTRQDIIKAVGSHRAELREGLERFLTPDQLKKWDAEVAKAREFLGHAAA
jgi:hypothetical protein